jgi:hypothetical protein
VDLIRSTEYYLGIENRLNELAARGSFDPFTGGMRFLEPEAMPEKIEEGRQLWRGIAEKLGGEVRESENHTGHGQDIVEQLIVGLGWRVTAEYNGTTTRSVLCTSSDAQGVKITISCLKENCDDSASIQSPSRGVVAKGDSEEMYTHFKREHLDRFFGCHVGRMGIAVLGFEVDEGCVERVLCNYRNMHPNLLVDNQIHAYEDSRTIKHSAAGAHQVLPQGALRMVEVFAYYKDSATREADQGTVIRFVERSGTYASTAGFSNPEGVLPGLVNVPHTFNGTSIPAYADHWVSNVVDRQAFLDVLHDTLGFTPKVDFNAGVVAAGEAQIESTVTGNASKVLSRTENDVLMNQTQVYLPINNPLSPVGHVHWFIEEMGQGVQHVAARVKHLPQFIERVNNYRKMTGMGFAFLNIPRSYYGRLASKDLEAAGIDSETATALLKQLEQAKLVSNTGIVEFGITDEAIAAQFNGVDLTDAQKQELTVLIKRGRYSNMYKLLRDNLTERTYLRVVENKILVDVQGGDILYQIFTQTIMQRQAGEEAPFLEFIQRVCSETRDGACELNKPIKPGCGGFGIRNFLTLFLSIEVSKAMREYDTAVVANEDAAAALAEAKINLFTSQLDAANPILTDITDAMTAEGEALEGMKTCPAGDKAALQAALEAAQAKKAKGNDRLQELSAKCAAEMGALRLKAEALNK